MYSLFILVPSASAAKHLVSMGLLGDLAAFFAAILIARWFQIS